MSGTSLSPTSLVDPAFLTEVEPLFDRRIPAPSIGLHGLSMVDAEVAWVVSWLENRLRAGFRTRAVYVNAHCANIARRDPEYAAALASADVVLPDGSGVALAARLQGRRFRGNLNGTDLVPALCARLGMMGRSVYLLGGEDGVARAAGEALQAQCPGLRVAGARSGFFAESEEESVITAINRSGADMLLVARGVPLQDTFLATVSDRVDAPLQMGVGGLFDFLAGRLPRAPVWMRSLGLEWTYRLWQEPRRMWQRYILGNPAYVAHAVMEAAPVIGRGLDTRLKRVLDIALSAATMAVLAPLLVLVGLTIRCTTVGPAIFRQTRIGKDGQVFTMLKFRSMVDGAESIQDNLTAQNVHGSHAVMFKVIGDSRITTIGAWLRRTSIDEVPQLWNVLRGDMSLVGPRPPLPCEVARYSDAQWQRLTIKPGMTCLWQVKGRSNVCFERQVELDLEYIAKRSLILDLAILSRLFLSHTRMAG